MDNIGIIPIQLRHKEKVFPESLFDLCLKYIVKNLHLICIEDNEIGHKLHEELALPRNVCEGIIKAYQNYYGRIFNSAARLFEDVSKTNLRSIHIHKSDISDRGLKYLLRHNLYEISLSECYYLTPKSFVNIFKYAVNLRSLTIGPYVGIFSSIEHQNIFDTYSNAFSTIRYSKEAPNLKHLILRIPGYFPSTSDKLILNGIHDELLLLRVLDLSYWPNVGNLQCLNKLTTLHTLILYNVPNLQNKYALSNICMLKTLVVLDISQSNPDQGVYTNENKILAFMLMHLPKLMSLDISGTNLAGNGIADENSVESLSGKKSDIPGLECRVDNPLEFLGLYRTMHNACQRHDIPAKIISGNATEKQIFYAVSSCMDKPEFLEYVLFDIENLFEFGPCVRVDLALDFVLEILARHVTKPVIQRSGIGLLFHILRRRLLPLLSDECMITVKRRIVTSIISGMEYHIHNETILFHGFTALMEMETPQDVMFEFKRIINLLFNILHTSKRDNRRTSLDLLLIITNHVNNEQKNYLGNVGTIKKMMMIIKDQLQRNVFDDVLQDAWLMISDITNGVPNNCERFLVEDGINCFLRCLNTSPDPDGLDRITLILMFNVAEVKELRPRLMQACLIEMFSELLFSSETEFEVKYYSAGVIAHLASDGYEAWVLRSPSRSKLLKRMAQVMKSWPLYVNDICYDRSIEPILKLAQVKHTPECQFWALWSLENFTKIHPNGCQMVMDKYGLTIMSEVIRENANYQNELSRIICCLAHTIIGQCLKYLANVN